MPRAVAHCTARFLIAMLAMYCTGAMACEGPYRPKLSDFLRDHVDQTIFVGTIVATTPAWRKWLGQPEASTILVRTWYAGRTPLMMTLPHVIPVVHPSMPCQDSQPYFEARVGEHWLIIGTPVGDVIAPRQEVSIRAEEGGFPPEVVLALGALRPAARADKR